MKNFLRRIRGLVGMGITWAAGFVAFGGGYALISGNWRGLLSGLPLIASIGFLVGGAFGGILALTEGSKRLTDLSLWRVAIWGALGSALAISAISLVVGGFPPWHFWLVFSGLSATFAAGQVAIARKGEEKLIERGDAPMILEGETEE